MPTTIFDKPPKPTPKPAAPLPELTIEMVIERDPDATLEPADGMEFTSDELARLDSLRWELWHYIGVRARATVVIPYGASFIETTIESPGFWGIESDSSPEYLAEVYEEECRTLRFMLESISQAISQPISGPENQTPGTPSPLLAALLDPCMMPALEAYAASGNANAVRCLENARAAVASAGSPS